MNLTLNLKNIHALMIDIDGTLLRGDQALPGMVELINFLRQNHISFMVASNNATKTPAVYQQKFAALGADVLTENVLTCSTATAAFLKIEYEPGTPIYVIGMHGLHNALAEAGYDILQDASREAETVVVGGDYGLTYDKLKYAALHIQRGARFIGTNPDVAFPTEEGILPENGATLAALEAATGIRPTVIGKPERYLFDMAVEKMGTSPEQTAILGDRLETDIVGGQQAGLKTILVTTGVDNLDTISEKGIQPDLIVHGLRELVELWQSQMT